MLDLFSISLPEQRLHPLFKMLADARHLPERHVIESWAEGFSDRDGKFVNEFQTTFESSFWELYIHACLKEFGASINFSHYAPDFVVEQPEAFCVEATIAAPAAGGQSAFGYDAAAVPNDFNAFNAQAAIRIANSISTKLKKYRSSYSNLSHAKDRPFVLAIGAFDRPFAHFASNRPPVAALFGLNYDEEAAIALGPDATEIPNYVVSGALKQNGAPVPLGLFLDETAHEVSAVIYSCLASWGKVRALADNPDAMSIYRTLHPSPQGIIPEIRVAKKRDYTEHLVDGLYVFHNPFASHPLDPQTFYHPRAANVFLNEDGSLDFQAPDDFLLMRMVQSVVLRD